MMGWTDFLSSQTLGIILGALLTAGFTWFIEFLRAQRDECLYLKRKKEETYLDALNLILNSAYPVSSDEWMQQLKSTISKVALYLSSQECNNFMKLVESAKSNHTIDELQVDKFVKYCKKQLKIKD